MVTMRVRDLVEYYLQHGEIPRWLTLDELYELKEKERAGEIKRYCEEIFPGRPAEAGRCAEDIYYALDHAYTLLWERLR